MDYSAFEQDGNVFDIPHGMAQTQQIYGNYNPESSPVNANFGNNNYGDSQDHGSNDEGDSKRRRIARVRL